jgi:hypothetical protein
MGALLDLPEYASEYHPPPLRRNDVNDIFLATGLSQIGHVGAFSFNPTIFSNSLMQIKQMYS